MHIGVIADDFTGASDIALTLAEGGMNVAQFVGVPNQDADTALDAGVIALKSRTAPVADAIAQSLSACDWLRAQGTEQIVFKVCSTFDSTADGNIGPVLDALADRLKARHVIVCPAFPENGRSVYQAHLFVGDALLNESGMEDHPLTPMRDADLRRVLAAQSKRDVGHISTTSVLHGHETIKADLDRLNGHVIVDAVSDADLIEIGRAAKGMPLICGGSGIALGLPSNFSIGKTSCSWSKTTGPGVVLSGSCSRATRAQVATYQAQAPSMQIDAQAAVNGSFDVNKLADWVMSQPKPPLVFSSADPDEVRAAQSVLGSEQSAAALEAIFADLAATLADRGVRRIVVAGGETSGAVVNGLGISQLNIGPRAASGVPLVRSGDLVLALKSGNFGGPDFFQDTLRLMETGKT